MPGLNLLAQTRVTVPAPVVVHEVPLWQVIAVGGGVLLLLLVLVALIVAAVASLYRTRNNPDNETL